LVGTSQYQFDHRAEPEDAQRDETRQVAAVQIDPQKRQDPEPDEQATGRFAVFETTQGVGL